MTTGIGSTLSGYVKEMSASCNESLSHYMPTMSGTAAFIKDRLVFPQKDSASKAISGLIISGALISANQIGLIAGTSTVMMIGSLTLGIYIGNLKGTEHINQKARNASLSEAAAEVQLSEKIARYQCVEKLEAALKREGSKLTLEQIKKIETIGLVVESAAMKIEELQDEDHELSEEVFDQLAGVIEMLDGVSESISKLADVEEL